MMETQPAFAPHMGAQNLYDFCDDAEALGRLKTVQLPAELMPLPMDKEIGIGGVSDGGAIGGGSMENAEHPHKKRKRCGVCTPCLRKEPCGACYNCVNRSTSHQICKMRKCVELKKKRVVPLKGLESCSESTSVDGPETDQMEAGPVNHVQEGRLNLKCDPGLQNKGCKDLQNGLLMETNSWLSNIPVPQNSGDKIGWDNPPVPSHAATNDSSSLEDAKNLVAFSAVAEAMSYGVLRSGTPSLPSVQLYEKFNYEMNRESSDPSANKPPDCPEDLNTLKAALELAKHGVKPPNCNCDGPECPDYLEWLENKIKGHPESSQNLLSHIGREIIDNSYPKDQVLSLENKTTQCTSGPLPFSQNALSIAKEKNISLQTAIAIEALTQLSSALPQPNTDSPNGPSPTSAASHGHLPYFPSVRNDHVHGLPISCNELFENQEYTGKNALPMSQPSRHTSWEQTKKASFQEGQYIPENHLSHGSPVLKNQISTPQKSEFMQQWVQTQEQLKSPSDPMTGLKQLLGDANDYIKSVFKGPESLPTKVKKSRQGSVKKEATEMYKISPNQQQLSQLLQEADFHRTAQAALQQHLHHKRNLFLDSNSVQEGSPEQPLWWVPNSPKVPKTAEKPVRERKKRVQSSSNKKAELKTKTPRKQIQIKKPRQKDGQPVFMPLTQINIEELRRAPSVEPKHNDQSIPNLEDNSNSNTQEMCTESQGDGQGRGLTHSVLKTNAFGPKNLCSRSSIEDTTSSSGPGDSLDQPASAGNASAQNESIDDKFEDLIRQFEAEFGGEFPLPGAEIPSQNGGGPPKSSMELQSKLPFPSQMLPADTTTRSRTHSNPTRSNTSLPQEMPENLENLFSKSPKKIKIESSGAITVVSTTCFYSEENQQLDGTPAKSDMPFNPTLAGFLESPLNYLTSPTKSLLDTPAKKAQAEFPTCTCVEQINEKDEGPYYTHLGSGTSVPAIRNLMEERYGEKGKAIRIEKVVYTGKEGKSSRGCPIAKWVIRRQSEEEKLLVLVRHRAGHSCENAVIIILIMAWEGIPRALGDSLYSTLTETITKYGNPTSRRCGLNDDRTCACQGKDPNTCGASFSFGCSWSMYFNGCKYARSKTPRKFRLVGDNPKEEDVLKDSFQTLATKVAPVYKQLAPQAYTNQINNEEVAIDCRLGLQEGRPFSGVTACMDFCAHAHKDQHNLYNGCTVVCTLTKEDNRTVGKIAEDEQLHVLPLYKICSTDEFGSEEAQAEKIRKGGLQVLTSFPREVRKLPEPAKSCRQRQLEAKKAAAEKKKLQKEKLTPSDKPKPEPEDLKLNQQSPGMTQQPVKPCVKVEPSNPYNTFKYNANGVVESYSVLGSCRPSDPYSMNSVYSYHSFYAQPPTLPSLNGYHSKFALPSFGYYGFSSNPVVPSQYMNYGAGDAKSGGWMNNKKPEIQSGSESTSQGYGNEQSYGKSGDSRSTSTPLRTTPAPVDTTPYFNKVIKKEPVNDYSYDPFQRSPSIHSPSPALNLSMPKNDQAFPFKANGALPSSERTNLEGSQNMYMTGEKANLANGLDKRDYYGAQANGVGYKNYHAQSKPWGAYGLDAQAVQRDSNTPVKVWSSCKLNDGSTNLISSENAQDKNWNGGRAMKETTTFQEKLWNSVAGSDRCSVTPSGMQDKSWNMFSAPAAPSTPLKSDSWDPYGLDDNLEETPAKKEEEEEEEEWSDSEHNFLDENIGGVAVAPAHGSILIECARRELHATTPLKKPNRCHPTRISLVFYQHKNLNQPNHGLALWEAKMKLLAERARLRQEEAARLGIKQEVKSFGKKRKWGGAATPETPPIDRKDFIPTREAATRLTNSFTTSSMYAYTKVTGPYNLYK